VAVVEVEIYRVVPELTTLVTGDGTIVDVTVHIASWILLEAARAPLLDLIRIYKNLKKRIIIRRYNYLSTYRSKRSKKR